jgi:hypothetical protein
VKNTLLGVSPFSTDDASASGVKNSPRRFQRLQPGSSQIFEITRVSGFAYGKYGNQILANAESTTRYRALAKLFAKIGYG